MGRHWRDFGCSKAVLSGRTLNQLAAQPDIAADPQTTALRLLVLRAAELGR
jgi:hypothetical protein